MSAAPAPLAGVRILDLSRLLPGPYLTMILSDLGADVVKVEDPRLGDYLRMIPPFAAGGVSARFQAVNRDKRSVALDLKRPAGRDAFLRLVERADVVVESFRPGVIDKLGVGWDVLAARNPRVILCSISGYGQTGPYRERAGHDLNYVGLAGILAMTGAAGGAPVLPGVQIADLAGGALWGAIGVLGALVGRAATGQGRHLDISMAEGALALLATEVANLGAAGAPTRGSEALNGGLAAYGVYRTSDGKYVAVAALEPKFWLPFNGAIGRRGEVAELLAPPDVQARIRGEIQAIIETRTRAEWEQVFARADVCCEPVLELGELPAHPLHETRRVFFRAGEDGAGGGSGGGAGAAAGAQGPLLVRTPVGEAAARRAAPRLGEHTAEVLREHGFSDAEIAAVRG